MANNKASTVVTGNNYGGLTAGQINVSEDAESKGQKIRSWLSPLKFWEKQENVYSEHHSRTGKWFLKSDEDKSWVNGNTTNLWCHGAPGSGKTVLASIAVNYLRQRLPKDDGVGVAVLYCEWKRHGIFTAANLLASIWDQLSVDKPLAGDVQGLYDHHTKFGTAVKYQEVLSILKSAVEGFTSVYIVIDALDELGEHDDCANLFIGALTELDQSTRRDVHVLTTSRSAQPALSRPSSLHITANTKDIELYAQNAISHGLSSSRHLSDQIRDDSNLRQKLVQHIGVKASGLFLLARLFVQSLKYKTNLRDLTNAIEKLPSSINEQYAETLSRIGQQNSDHRNLAWRILSWLTHASRPLKVQELRHALAVRQGDRNIDIERLDVEDLFVPCCHGLVSIEQETQVIRLVHHTTQQYLEDNRLTLFPDAHAQILCACLTYLSFNEFRRGRCSFDNFDTYHVNEVANGKRIAKRRFLPNRLLNFPFLHYAASNWGRHAIGEVGLHYQDKILAFLESSMLLESAAQVQDSDMLYSSPRSEESINNIRKNLPLFVAGSFGLDHITDALLTGSDKIDVNATHGSKNSLVLHQAVERGNAGLAHVLLNAGANPRLLESNSYFGAKHSILYKAIAHGYDAIVEILLSQSQGELVEPSAIYCAVVRESEAVIRLILNHSHGEARRKDRLHQILLHAACLGRLSVLELAIRLGAKLDAKGADGLTALSTAVKYGRPAAVEILLKANASATERDASGASLLQIAVYAHEVIQERLRCIREYGNNYAGILDSSIGPGSLSEPMAPDNWFMESLGTWLEDCQAKELFKSPQFKEDLYEDSRHVEVITKILACNGDVSQRTPEGATLLHHAACITPQRVRAFLKNSSSNLDVDGPDNDGRTPLHYAAAMGKVDTMRALLDHGARIDIQDRYQATTLHFGILSPACTKRTIKRGDLIHAQDNFCRTALHYATLVEEPKDRVEELLLTAGVRSGTVDLHGQTAQYYRNKFDPETSNSQDTVGWIGIKFYQGWYASREQELYSAIDNSRYYHKQHSARFSRQRQKSRSTLGESGKTWAVVSDSEDEDFSD